MHWVFSDIHLAFPKVSDIGLGSEVQEVLLELFWIPPDWYTMFYLH